MDGYVEIGGLEPFFADFEEFAHKKPREMLQKRSGAMARYFAESTMPVAGLDAADPMQDNPSGKSKAARDLGQAAVRRDIGRVYTSPSTIFRLIRAAPPIGPGGKPEDGLRAARAFTKFIKTGNFAGARRLLQGLGISAKSLEIVPWDGGRRHQQMRNSRGRINAGTKPQVVSDGKALAEYTKKIVARVGWAKSGWYSAGRGIQGSQGLGGLPTWMKQPAPGSGQDFTNEENPHIILTNQVSYAADAIPEDQVNRARNAFEESLVKELKTLTDKLAAKHREVTT